MTEQAAQAKRLFDSEKWNEANLALRRVASGETGDDEGNKHIAEYHAAIALFRMKRDTEAAQAFRTIASKSNHLKHNETILWLVKIADQHPEHLTPIDFATYTIDQVERFHNPSQEGIYQAASFFLGRERLAEGKRDQAKLLLDHVNPNHPYAAAAKKCAALAK